MKTRHTAVSQSRAAHAPGFSRGMTLIELMVTLAVLVIGLVIAVPSFTDFVKNTRLTATATDVQAALNLARSEAVTRRQAVSVCMSTNGTACDGTAWKDGMLVFTNIKRGSDPGQFSNTNQALKYIQVTDPGLTISSVTPPGASTGFGAAKYVLFKSSGMVDNAQGGELLVCDNRSGTYGQRILVSPVGRTEMTRNCGCPATNTDTCPAP